MKHYCNQLKERQHFEGGRDFVVKVAQLEAGAASEQQLVVWTLSMGLIQRGPLPRLVCKKCVMIVYACYRKQ